MLYVCLPVHNEAATVGVLLWRLRTVLQDAGRDYEVVVYDDASTDATAEVLAPYAQVLPLTVIGGPAASPRGRSAATVSLLRHVATHARYPRRDTCLVLQGDFTERPEELPAYLAAFDGGSDLVLGRRPPSPEMPLPERRLRRLAPWVLRPLVRVEGVNDLLAGPRLLRVSVVRDLLRSRGDGRVLEWDGWAGQAELVVAAVPFARRVTVVDVPESPAVRTRPSRLDWAQELRALARFAWQARGTRVRPQNAPAAAPAGAPANAPVTPAPPPTEPAGTSTVGGAHPARPERPRRSKSSAPAPSSTTASAAPEAAPAPTRSDAPTSAPRPERPRTLGRGRRAERAAAGEAPQVPAPGGPQPEPVESTPVIAERATVAPEQDPEAGTFATEAEGGEAAEGGGRARRRKRRSRRRASADAPTVGAPTAGELVGEAADEVAAAEPRPETEDLGSNLTHTPREDDGAEAEIGGEIGGVADAGSAAKRRRRRRGRGRSAGALPGVQEGESAGPTDTAAGGALPAGVGAFDPPPAQPPGPPPAADRKSPPE